MAAVLASEGPSGRAGAPWWRGRRARWGRRALGAALLLAAVAAALAVLVARPPGGEPGRADAVVVFAGRRERLPAGVSLVRRGVAPVLVVSDGGDGHWGCPHPAGVPTVCVTPRPATTAGEARAFARLARERGWRVLVGVTSTYHARRAGLLLARCHDGEVRMVPAPPRRGGAGLADVLVEAAAYGQALLASWPCGR